MALRSSELEDLIAAIASGAAERARLDQSPFDQIELIRQFRLGTVTLPLDEGGHGVSVRELLSLVIDLAEADPNVAHILRAHFWQVNEILRLPASPQRNAWLEEIRSGKIFGNASSEKGNRAAGASSFATALTRSGQDFILNGEKFYSTGSLFSDWLAVSAQVDESTIASVIIPSDRDGVTIVDDWDGIGQNRTGTGTTVFDNVVVHPNEVITLRSTSDITPRPSDGALLQLYLQAIVTGILRNVVTDAIGLIHSRARTFSHALAEQPAQDPILQHVIGKIASTTYVAEAAVLTAADAIDAAYRSEREGNPDSALFTAASLAAAKVKIHVDEVGLASATALFEVGGASAATRSKNLDRHWRNIRTLTLHNPTSYKAVAVGNTTINDATLPLNGYF
ncbi:acyl-CoA dehydrogenase [Rhodococcus sp. 1168]|nr:acyl-CoA dehydrogenase [Rhodococcus sp. 1168]